MKYIMLVYGEVEQKSFKVKATSNANAWLCVSYTKLTVMP